MGRLKGNVGDGRACVIGASPQIQVRVTFMNHLNVLKHCNIVLLERCFTKLITFCSATFSNSLIAKLNFQNPSDLQLSQPDSFDIL